jgi:hypothetical protein
MTWREYLFKKKSRSLSESNGHPLSDTFESPKRDTNIIHYNVSVRLFVCRASKVHQGLTHWFTWAENCTQSTTEIVVPYSTIDDRPRCTTMYRYLCKNALKGRKCEGNSSCTNNQLLVFIFHISYTIFFEGILFINYLANIV